VGVRAGLGRLKANVLGHVAARPITAGLDAPTFSMTFDDVHQSAVRHGVPILLDHHADATFYVASGLRSDDGFLDSSDLETLQANGFDIGCHSFSHYSLDRGTSAGLAADAARNRSAFEHELHLGRPRDFCYPFGEVSLSAKRLIGHEYATARSTYPGVNSIGSDLLLLRANTLFSASVSWKAVRRLLAAATEANGWIIFYTHGVDDDPDQRSCAPDDLDRLLGECRRAGLTTRSVRSVSEELLPDWSPRVAATP
jgi:peptidoglycan/xylan/chitin deacetylase (PgdA/CDA1 family)